MPHDHLEQVALVGRSNVGKSSLINALVGARVARTSGAPGKTRLANIYRVARGTGTPFYLVDLPGYGYARGGAEAARGFDELTQAYFGQVGRIGQVREVGGNPAALPGLPDPPGRISVLLLVDARHSGLQSDIGAWRWLQATVAQAAVVATKVDKLARGERIRAMRKLESVFEDSVIPVSAVTGEGLDELWKLIDRLANSRRPQHRRSSLPKATAPPNPRKK